MRTVGRRTPIRSPRRSVRAVPSSRAASRFRRSRRRLPARRASQPPCARRSEVGLLLVPGVVLFVDADQAEPRKRGEDGRGARTDHDRRRPGRDAFALVAPLGLAQRRVQDRHAVAETCPEVRRPSVARARSRGRGRSRRGRGRAPWPRPAGRPRSSRGRWRRRGGSGPRPRRRRARAWRAHAPVEQSTPAARLRERPARPVAAVPCGARACRRDESQRAAGAFEP